MLDTLFYDLLILLWGSLAFNPLAFFGFGCCCPTCDFCDGSRPQQYQVVIAGITNGTCTACASYNATFVLDYDPTATAGGTRCDWSWTWPSAPCPGDSNVELWWDKPASNYRLSVAINPTTLFRDTYGTTKESCNPSGLSVTRSGFLNTRCVWTSSTCAVTAL